MRNQAAGATNFPTSPLNSVRCIEVSLPYKDKLRTNYISEQKNEKQKFNPSSLSRSSNLALGGMGGREVFHLASTIL